LNDERGQHPGSNAPGDGTLDSADAGTERRPDRGSGPDAQDLGVGDLAPEHPLENDSGYGKTRSDHETHEQTRHADSPHHCLRLIRLPTKPVETDSCGEHAGDIARADIDCSHAQ
jgi:hypothetical protein